ncbi:MAG: hypothetical protein ACREFY_00255 [Acetobacteraceae bacterium]
MQPASRATGIAMAGACVERIEAAWPTLETFPECGTKHDDIRPCLTTIGFERRTTVVFQIT